MRADTQSQRPAIRALFGAQRILGLERLMASFGDEDAVRSGLSRLGYGPDALRTTAAASEPLYPENRPHGDVANAVKELLVRESLAFGIASAETAFVAIRRVAGKQVEETVLVGNALAHGWSDDFLSPAMGTVLVRSMLLRSPGVARAGFAPPPSPASMPMFSSPADAAASPRQKAPGLVRRMLSGLGGGGRGSGPSQPEEVEEVELEAGDVDTGASTPAGNVFRGVPAFANGEAVLFDSGTPASGFPTGALRVNGLRATITGRPASIDRSLTLLLFVGDLAAPRARMRLADLVRDGKVRPLNLTRGAGEVVRIVLTGAGWPADAGSLEVSLRW